MTAVLARNNAWHRFAFAANFWPKLLSFVSGFTAMPLFFRIRSSGARSKCTRPVPA